MGWRAVAARPASGTLAKTECILVLDDPILEFTFLVIAALAVQLAFRKLPVPALVGLLIVGMLVGPGGAEILTPDPVVELLGSIGLLYIMFLAGLEIDLDVVRGHKREAASFGFAAFILCFVPAVGIGFVLGLEWAGAALLAAAISSHTLIAYPMVEKMELLHRRSVVAAVGGTLLTDTAALIILVLVLQAAGAEGSALGGAAPILILAGLAAAALFGVPRLTRYVFDVIGASQAERALYVIAVLVALAALAELIGTEDILGAFLAGLCLNRMLKGREVLFEHMIFAGRMMFIPFFFIQTGMRLDLQVFSEGSLWATAALLLAVILIGKATAAWITGRLFDYGRTERLVMTGLTIPQAAATLAVTTTASEAGLMGDQIVDAVIIVIFLTCLAGALTTRYAGAKVAGRLRQEDLGTERM